MISLSSGQVCWINTLINPVMTQTQSPTVLSQYCVCKLSAEWCHCRAGKGVMTDINERVSGQSDLRSAGPKHTDCAVRLLPETAVNHCDRPTPRLRLCAGVIIPNQTPPVTEVQISLIGCQYETESASPSLSISPSFKAFKPKLSIRKCLRHGKKPSPHSEVQRRKSYRLYWDVNSWDTAAFSEDIQARFKSRANKWGLILECQTDNHTVCSSSLVKENTLASQSALLWPRATA